MGWITVETPNAVYKVAFETHFRKARVPEGIDAVVLEMANTPREVIGGLAERDVIYSRFNEFAASGKPIFHGDTFAMDNEFEKMGKNLARLTGITVFATWMFGAPGFYTATGVRIASEFSKHFIVPGKELKMRRKLLPAMTAADKIYEIKNTVVHLRDALIAEKAESRIAPHMRKKLGRKPVIAIVYGAGHYNIARLLNKPTERRRTIQEIATNVPREWLAFTTEITYDSKRKAWSMKNLDNIPIPKRKSAMQRWRARARLARVKTKRAIKRM